MNIPENYRQAQLYINGKLFKVDAYVPQCNTVYEFYGDYWHGNLQVFSPNDLNKRAKKTFVQLFEETNKRENIIKQAGYQVVSIWENDYKKLFGIPSVKT